MNSFILESVPSGNFFKCIYMAISHPVFLSEQKAKIGTSARQILGATDLKLGMHTQLDLDSYMG